MDGQTKAFKTLPEIVRPTDLAAYCDCTLGSVYGKLRRGDLPPELLITPYRWKREEILPHLKVFQTFKKSGETVRKAFGKQ